MKYLSWVLLILLGSYTHFSVADEPGDSRPNILLIVADDHGTDAIGAYGNPVIKTPSIDALAKKGTRFNHAYGTSSSCSPSRAVLLTGLHNHANGMYGLEHWENHFSSFDTIKSLPVLLGEGGYRTARVGKYHIAPEQVYRFDKVLSEGKANDMKSIARSPVEMAELSKKFIEESEQPFFLYFASDDPHRTFPFETYPEPNSFGNTVDSYPGINPVKYKPEDVIVPSFLPDNLQTRKELAEYYQAVSRLDQGVGRLIEILKETGADKNTIIIYLSDNGVAFPGAKTTVYDPGLRLPLIVNLPGANRSEMVSDAMVSWVDITPTILDYAGLLNTNDSFHGRSFKSLLSGKSKASEWQEIYASHTFHEVVMYYPMRMIRDKHYKLIWNIAHALDYPSTWDLEESLTWQGVLKSQQTRYAKRDISAFVSRPEFELYDMQADPDEIHNLAYNEKYSTILSVMVEKIKRFQQQTDDPWFRKWRYK